MNFVLTFLAYDTMTAMLVAMFGKVGTIQSPFWFTAKSRAPLSAWSSVASRPASAATAARRWGASGGWSTNVYIR